MKKTINKSAWPVGPWQDEPDYLEWIESGYACYAMRNQMGSWCGYIGIPLGHSMYGKYYGDLPLDVHGGLTYSASDGDTWWVGFDCAHLSDMCPAPFLFNIDQSDRTYRDLPYVQAELVSLALQLGKTNVSL